MLLWRNSTTVNVINFGTLVACQICIDKQCRPRPDCFWRSSLIWAFPVCYSDKYFVNSSPENQYFIWEQKQKCVRNFRTFTVFPNYQIISLFFQEGRLPKGSYVFLTALADGRVLYDNLYNRTHPIGSLKNDVTYSQFYDYFNCLQVCMFISYLAY